MTFTTQFAVMEAISEQAWKLRRRAAEEGDFGLFNPWKVFGKKLTLLKDLEMRDFVQRNIFENYLLSDCPGGI